MDVVRTRCPARIADPINLEQLAARILGGLPEHGTQPGDGVDEFVACISHVFSSFAAFCFDLSLQPAAPRLCFGRYRPSPALMS